MYADGQGPKPKEIKLYEDCVYWHTLPVAGGIWEQPYGVLDRSRTAVNIYDAIKAYNQHWSEPGWVDDNPEVLKTMVLYWDLRDEVEKNGRV